MFPVVTTVLNAGVTDDGNLFRAVMTWSCFWRERKDGNPSSPACQSFPLGTCIKFTPRPKRNLVVLSLHVTALELASVCIPVL